MAVESRTRAIVSASRRIVVADGAGAPWGSLQPLLEEFQGEVFIGWCLGDGLDWAIPSATLQFRSFMGGNGARHLTKSEHFSYVPVRFSHLPRAFATWMRPYTLVLTATNDGSGWALGTEAGWIPAAARYADNVIVVPNPDVPRLTSVAPLELVDPVVLEPSARQPDEFVVSTIDDVSHRIGEVVASLLPDGAAIQYGPGPIGAATLHALNKPVRVRSGIVSDAVLDAVRLGTVSGRPCGAYAVGSRDFYDEIAGLGWVDRVEVTHDHSSLASDVFVAVNTALEVDTSGQVNVEHVGGRVVAGLGGHADFAFAAASSQQGFSIVALPSRRGSASTLVDRFDSCVTTQRSDIDVFVNEHGHVDVRGMSDREKSRALRALWDH